MKFAIALSAFILVSPVLCFKTFYEEDLKTTDLFRNREQVQDLCQTLGDFYDGKNEVITLSRCIRFKASQLLFCNGEFESFKNFSNKAKLERIESLVICGHNRHEFNPNLLKYFLKLKNLYIGKSSFEAFTNKLPKLEHLEFVKLNDTDLHTIRGDFFSELSSIEHIDLHKNKLTYVEKLLFITNDQVKLFLSRNAWDCTKNLKWMTVNEPRFEIADKDTMNCSDIKYKGRPILTVMNYKLQLYKICHQDPELRNCSCHMSYLRLNEERNNYHPMFSVNCSAAGFYNFPQKLPENTTTLFISHNRISSLDMLCTENSTYNNVHDIYLDYNRISDASVLENCEWFLNFRVMSLKGNQLEKIPNYAFKKSFEKSQHALRLYLSENPWLCTCNLQPRLLKLCQKYELIVDQKQMRCLSSRNDARIYGKSLMELSRLDVCPEDEIALNIYEILSMIFVFLILLILLNLIYDYYVYRNYGKLPWLVLHTPFF